MKLSSHFFKQSLLAIAVIAFAILTETPAFGQNSSKRLSPSVQKLFDLEVDSALGLPKTLLRLQSKGKLSKATEFANGTIRGYISNLNGSTWAIVGKTIVVYANKQVMKDASITLASQSNLTAGVTLYSYEYYSNGLLMRTTRPDWGRTTYTYNDSGKTLSYLSTYFVQGKEVPQLRSSYTYRNGTVLSQILVETYANATWNNSTRTTYFSDSVGVQDSVLTESWQNGWILSAKGIYSRNKMDHSTTRLNYYQNGTPGVLQLSSRTITVTDSLGHFVSQQTDNYTAGTWTPSQQEVYTYDSEGFLQIHMYSYWDTYSLVWRQYYKYEYSKYPNPQVTLIAPNEGDNYPSTSPLKIQWLTSGVSSVDLFSSTDNGSTWQTIATNVPDTGYSSYNWIAPASEYTQCKVRVTANGNLSVQHILEGTFSTLNIVSKVDHTTNSLRLSVLNNGYLGADPNGNGSGLTYGASPNALFSAGVFIGTATGQGKGMVGSFGIADFQNSQSMKPLTSNARFDQVGTTTIQENYTTYYSEIGIRSQSRMSDDFVFVSYTLRNKGYSAWSDMYLGVFADWDIGNPFSNFGGIDSARGLAYQYESGSSLSDSNYYGIIALTRFSGATVTTDPVTSSTLISTIRSIRKPSIAGDNRMFIGSGPYVISPGDSSTVDFALVAGSNLKDLQANADSAKKLWKSVVVAIAGFEASATSLNFGRVSVSKTKRDSIVVTNTGTASLTITELSCSNSVFTVTPLSALLGVQAQQKFYVTFAPTTLGEQVGKIAFQHNAPSNDTITVTGNGVEGVSEVSDGAIPREYELRSNYPNPFNPSTTILYGLPSRSRVVLQVYSLLGQKVMTLVDGIQDAGYHRAVWNGQQSGIDLAASGVYLFRITARPVQKGREGFTQVKKMLLLR